jgi:NifB/MoaA-like Fe-S oxidoreductase
VTDEPQQRRSTDREISQIDKRLGYLERDVERVVKEQLPAISEKLDVIHDGMSEPAASPLGRQYERTRTQVESLLKWQSEMIGAAKLARMVQLLLGIVVALLTLAQITGSRA